MRIPGASSTKGGGTSVRDLTPLADRLSMLLVVRLFMAFVVLLSTVALEQIPIESGGKTIALIYIVVSLTFEGVHRLITRHTRWRGLALINLMLLVDGLFVAAVLAQSGQSRSAFIFLAYLHIVSVTLLVGFRTGLKIAVWHAVLLMAIWYLTNGGWIKPTASPDNITGQLPNQLAVASSIALLFVAIITAVFASMNERELRRRKGELTIINDLSSQIEQTRRPSEILQAIVDTSTSQLNGDRAVAICAHAGSIVMVGASNTTQVVSGESLYDLGGVILRAANTGQPVLVKSLDVHVDHVLVQALPNAVNVAVIPLIAEGEALAVLVVEFGEHSNRRVTRPMIDLLSNVAGRVALSLSNTFLLSEVQRLASVDGLTNLPNRRTFNQAIEREISRSQRSGVPVSLVMLDIDHFKSINDTYGHQMGDTVLAESASGVLNACRGEDLPARYGGEEIVVIMPNCSVDQAYAAAERIRTALSDANVTLKDVHASAGVATFPNHASNVQDLLAAADEALYHSKEGGRNRTTLSDRNVDGASQDADAIAQTN